MLRTNRNSERGLIPIPKSCYLVLLYIMFESFWGIGGFSDADGVSNNIFLLTFAYLFFGVFNYIFYRKRKLPSLSKSYYWVIGLIFLSFLLSMIMANVYYGQSFTQSILTYRFQYLMATPLFLAVIRPSMDDVIRSLQIFTIIYFCVYLTLVTGSIAYDFRSTEMSGVRGHNLVSILYFWYLCRLADKFDNRTLMIVIALCALIVLQDNRSTMFPVLLLSMYMILKVKSKYKILLVTLLALVFIGGLYMAWDNISALIEQTQDELSNPKYNRNKAFDFFLYHFSPNVWCEIFGNGILSLHVSPKVAKLMDYGVFNSDMGFLGYWNQFGILPIVLFLYLYIRAIVSRKFPMFLRLTAITTLACGLTISYFGAWGHMIYFIVFFYLYALYNTSNQQNNKLD